MQQQRLAKTISILVGIDFRISNLRRSKNICAGQGSHNPYQEAMHLIADEIGIPAWDHTVMKEVMDAVLLEEEIETLILKIALVRLSPLLF
jgi:hypothetical protein